MFYLPIRSVHFCSSELCRCPLHLISFIWSSRDRKSASSAKVTLVSRPACLSQPAGPWREDQWKYPRKTERHFLINRNNHLTIIFIPFSNSLIRAKNRIVKSGPAIFVWNIPTEINGPLTELERLPFEWKNRFSWWETKWTRGAFHSTKYSSLKFRVFHATNGTVVFSGSLD